MIKKRKTTKNTILLNKLNTSIAIGDMNSVNELLENNMDLNCPAEDGNYPVMIAVNTGNINALTALLNHGASPNAIDRKDGYSTLMKALTPKYLPNRLLIVKMLLKNGIDVNIIGRKGYTALYLAKLYHIRYIKLLKRYGAEF